MKNKILKRIAIDLDGTICEVKKPGQSYEDVEPLPGAIEAVQKLKAKGFEIVIHTARNMATHKSNVAKITAVQGPIITKWLEKYNCPYDELSLGKPHVDFYIDDKAIQFTNWKDVMITLNKKIGV